MSQINARQKARLELVLALKHVVPAILRFDQSIGGSLD